MTPERWQAEAEKFFGRPCYGTQYGDHDHICKICPLTRLLVEAVREFSPVPLCPHCGKNPPTYCATCWSQEHPPEPKRVWCKHWEWIDGDWKTRGWKYVGGGMEIVAQHNWDQCPVEKCGAPRPAAGGRDG